MGLLIASLLLMVIAELRDSGIEMVVNRIGDEAQKLSGCAENLGSAAIFVSLIWTLVLWLSVAVDRFG